ncbi:MAG TPA: hypothetical protein VF594_10985, partial [Rubricoccaceae bacterium]
LRPARLHFMAWPLCVLWTAYCVLPAAALALAQVATPALADTLMGSLNAAPESVVNPPWLHAIGLQIDVFAAGLCGGYVHMMRTSKAGTSLGTWTKNVLAAGFMGNYLPLVVGVVMPSVHALPSTAARGVAFFLGYAGFTVLTALQRLTPNGSLPNPPPGDVSP